ncbi:MAG: acylneuraminate cytidylyltransferase family protein [Acidobacteria bacterium]|nr:acylneuraminate cytidylyltransferase family protein [Acidobacteriota bacterium]
MNCIAIIPARGGSKRIPRKNVRSLVGQPLLAYTIEAAKVSGLFQRVVVSTDDPEIARLAEAFGAEAPFLRDPALADDQTPVSAATLDALCRLDPHGTSFAHVAQLMANCPLRNSDDIVQSHRQFVESRAAVQISVTRFGWQNPWWAFRRSPDLRLDPLFPDQMLQRSQDLPELFCPTGAVWWTRANVLRKEQTFHVQGRTGWEIPWQRGVDIDTEEDWEMAEILFRAAHRAGHAS